MAKSTVALGLAMFFAALVMAPMVRCNTHNPITEEFTVFTYVITRPGPEANFIPVAGNPNNPINRTRFGTVSVFGVPIRETISTDSPVIGQSQGINAISSFNGNQAYASFALSFDTGKNKGSTLQIQGSLERAGVAFKGELALVSGTKIFRSASGYVLLETVFQNTTAMEAIQRLQIYIKHDRN